MNKKPAPLGVSDVARAASDSGVETPKILIVDDRPENLFSLAKVLEETDAEVVQAGNGNDALTLCLNHKFAVALVDVQMPGMDGYELAELLRSSKETEHLPLIFVSAIHHDEAHIFRGFDAGAVDYITKPFDPRILLSKVRVFLKLDAQTRELKRQVEIEKAKSRLENILLSMSDSVVVVSERLIVETVNTATLALLGFEWEEIVGRPLSVVMAESDAREFFGAPVRPTEPRRGRLTVAASFENRRFTWRCKDGRQVPVMLSSSPFRDATGATMGTVLVARDRTEIAQLQEEYHQVIETANDGFASCDEEGKFLDVNNAMCALTGYGREELISMSLSELEVAAIADEDGRYVAHVVESREGRFESRFRRKDGRSTAVEVVATHNTELGRLYFFIRDISERKRREAQTRQQQKLESIGTLASGVAHEINNPINIVFNCAELIGDDAEPGSDAAVNARHIEEACERISTIVKALLSFARDDGQEHSPARMSDIVESTASLIRKVLEKDQIQVTVDVPKELPTIKCRSQQIQQVVMNLLTNARDALNSKYKEYSEDKVVSIWSRVWEESGQRWLRTWVQDRGTGMTPELMERVFEPFFTTKPRDEGTGLGLSVSHGIVAEHRGRMGVESKLGEYTRFYFDLAIDNGWSLEDGQSEENNDG